MNDAPDTHLDACATLDHFDQLLASLAERITRMAEEASNRPGNRKTDATRTHPMHKRTRCKI